MARKESDSPALLRALHDLRASETRIRERVEALRAEKATLEKRKDELAREMKAGEEEGSVWKSGTIAALVATAIAIAGATVAITMYMRGRA